MELLALHEESDHSDAETEAYWNGNCSDESVNLSSDEFSSESDVSDSDTDDIADVRVWRRVDLEQPPTAPPRFPFTGNSGLQADLSHKSDPLTYLCLFLDDYVVDTIVVETNRYADQMLGRSSQRPKSRTRHWEPVTADDIWLYFGILVLQGIIQKPQQRWYWSNNRILETPIFRKIMSEYRFSLIMKFLHFTNNDDFDATTHPSPKLKKIWEVYQALLRNFHTFLNAILASTKA